MNPEKSKEKVHELRVSNLEDDLWDKFEEIKAYKGITSNAQMIRYMITDMYRQLFEDSGA